MKSTRLVLLLLLSLSAATAAKIQAQEPGRSDAVTVLPVNEETVAETRRLITERPDVKRRVEYLDRGLVCAAAADGVFCSWRLLGTEPYETKFYLYRDGVKVSEEPIAATNYLDAQGTADSEYYVEAMAPNGKTSVSAPVRPLAKPYLEIKTERPADWKNDRDPKSRPMRYQLGNMSAADLDGDGAYEIVAIWESNSKDNAHDGFSAPVRLAAYKLTGEKLWELDLGVNIRSGAHYNPFLVYDFDLDGKAEIMIKTAPGSKDAAGKFVSEASRDPEIRAADNNADLRNATGRVLSGPEFLTVFSGATGEALDTARYLPARGDSLKRDWGDDYGNRVDRFLAAVAVLDGERPSGVFARGYYTKTALTAYVFKDGALKVQAAFDSDDRSQPENFAYRGRGNHGLTVADVDYDGKDEIIYGASLFDDDLSGVYPHAPGYPKLFHGDAQHVGDLVPDRPGLEIFSVHESGEAAFDMRDARTGELLWFLPFQGRDVGRGASDDVDPRTPGAESWAAGRFVTAAGEERPSPRMPVNFFCYWDGDLGRELQDGISIHKYNPETNRADVIFKADGCVSYGGTKATPFLNADLFGDWREETVYALADGSGFRVYTTIVPTRYRIPTLMHDPEYRLAVAWQNVGYNQPPHLDFALGFGVEEIPRPNVYAVAPNGDRLESGDDPARPISLE